ncbi:MAG TPA: Hpt domain-containing protein [Gammaproteobacteria bacterium]|jgi:HPt (histidine-containing phosphotransfer) domain-containing protein
MAETQDGLAGALAALQPEIRQMLAEDLPIDTQRSQEAFAAARWGQLREQVHRIKGTAQFCQLEALKLICARIEDGLASEKTPDAGIMGEFTLEVERVLGALQT